MDLDGTLTTLSSRSTSFREKRKLPEECKESPLLNFLSSSPVEPQNVTSSIEQKLPPMNSRIYGFDLENKKKRINYPNYSADNFDIGGSPKEVPPLDIGPITAPFDFKTQSRKFIFSPERTRATDNPINETDPTAIFTVKRYRSLVENKPSSEKGLCAMEALSEVVKNCEANDIFSLQVEVGAASDALKRAEPVSLTLMAGCQLFNVYVAKMWEKTYDINRTKQMIVQHCSSFSQRSKKCRHLISKFGLRFIHNNTVVLTHSYSQVVCSILQTAARDGRRFSVIVTETQPLKKGYRVAKQCEDYHIPCEVILDSSVASIMSRVDFVLVGVEAVLQNGGIINEVGTYQIALVAKALNKPFYVAAESYTFSTLFPLTQDDIPKREGGTILKLPEDGFKRNFRERDYTPAELIALLFTDMGILTTSDISDELSKLYT
jgi:translation initiation factor eIF-2B subunit alpha